MSISMVCLGAMLLLLSQRPGDLAVQAGLVASLLVGTTAYGLGVGAIPYTMVGEVFTPEHRTLGSCMAQATRCSANLSLKLISNWQEHHSVHTYQDSPLHHL
jgi:hypothetical protein